MPGSLSALLRNSRGKNGLCVTPITSTMSATMPPRVSQKPLRAKISRPRRLYTTPPLAFSHQVLIIAPFGEGAARLGLPDLDQRLEFFDSFARTRLEFTERSRQQNHFSGTLQLKHIHTRRLESLADDHSSVSFDQNRAAFFQSLGHDLAVLRQGTVNPRDHRNFVEFVPMGQADNFLARSDQGERHGRMTMNHAANFFVGVIRAGEKVDFKAGTARFSQARKTLSGQIEFEH